MKKNIEELNYSEFVGLINERNRPSGGIKTIQEVVVNARIDRGSKVLEIGSNTGFTSVNISLLAGASVVGIDPHKPSIKLATKYASSLGADKTKFIEASALNLPFEDSSFDIIWCSNVTSFIDDKHRAIYEYTRVLKPLGTLVIVPIYYRHKPPQHIIDEVSKAIACKIDVWDRDFWIRLFEKSAEANGACLEKYYTKDYEYIDQGDRIDQYIDFLMKKLPDEYSKQDLQSVRSRAKYFYELFNENNYKYAGYSTILMQKRLAADEPELFLSKEAE